MKKKLTAAKVWKKDTRKEGRNLSVRKARSGKNLEKALDKVFSK